MFHKWEEGGRCGRPPEWLLHAHPGLGAAEGADGAAHLELGAAFDGRQAQRVGLAVFGVEDLAAFPDVLALGLLGAANDLQPLERLALAVVRTLGAGGGRIDRKSTRLNSSHTVISYAVFCLKKKKKP